MLQDRLSSAESNPYAPPSAEQEKYRALSNDAGRGLQMLLLLQLFVIMVSLVFEAKQHESIVFSGPVFALSGLVIAIVAWRHKDLPAAAYGASAIVFAVLVVTLINVNGWGPAKGDAPITVMAYAYALAALPVTWWLLVVRHRVDGATMLP